MDNRQPYSLYYRAHIVKAEVWFFVAVLRSFDHVSFDRTYDVTNSIFEFFVPDSMEPYFLEIIGALAKEGIIDRLEKMPNRLFDAAEQV